MLHAINITISKKIILHDNIYNKHQLFKTNDLKKEKNDLTCNTH